MKSEKQTLVPRLRFPEFREAGEWDFRKLEDVCDVNPPNSTLPKSFIYIDLGSVEAGQLIKKQKISREKAPSRAQRILKKGDVIFQVVRPYQKNNLICEFGRDEKYVASTGYAQLRAFYSEGFLYQVVHSDDFVERVLSKCTGSNYPAINSNDLAKVRLAIPALDEQHKIANCLSSLDALIAAQADKVDALKTHKKGLMQQLFPREGDTVPPLRFPEFRDAGEWKEKKLGGLIEEYREKSTKQDEFEVFTSAREGLVRQRDYYENSRITERNNVGFNIIPPYYMTYRSRSDDRRFFFNENNLGMTGVISTYYPVFRMLDGNNKFFVELLSQYSRKIGKHSVGTSQTVLSMNELRKIELPIPKKEEQQKIADCLSPLDALIAAHTENLDSLKAHKKGLMQQLFPSHKAVSV